MPSFLPPPFSVAANSSILATYHEGESVPLTVMISRLGSGILVVPIIAILDAVAIAKAFGEFE